RITPSRGADPFCRDAIGLAQRRKRRGTGGTIGRRDTGYLRERSLADRHLPSGLACGARFARRSLRRVFRDVSETEPPTASRYVARCASLPARDHSVAFGDVSGG